MGPAALGFRRDGNHTACDTTVRGVKRILQIVFIIALTGFFLGFFLWKSNLHEVWTIMTPVSGNESVMIVGETSLSDWKRRSVTATVPPADPLSARSVGAISPTSWRKSLREKAVTATCPPDPPLAKSVGASSPMSSSLLWLENETTETLH